MATYRRGASGKEVERIQSGLAELGRYSGPIDGDFAGGTESGIVAFQRGNGLTADGVVGPDTWAALFSSETMPEPAIVTAPLEQRCVALTGSFETNAPPPDCFAGISGDFDGQGLSFGVCQWNFGQRSLQPFLDEMERTEGDALTDIFHDFATELRKVLAATYDEQMAWNALDPGCEESHRRAGALALMFDVKVQNGSIGDVVRAQIERDFAALQPTGDPATDEVARLRIITNRRAEASNPRWVHDVRTRKLTIANSEGVVHGRHYDLKAQYGITLGAA